VIALEWPPPSEQGKKVSSKSPSPSSQVYFLIHEKIYVDLFRVHRALLRVLG